MDYTDCMPMKGQELRRLRKRMALTQEQLAKKIGVTENTVARWERNEVSISEPATKLVKILAGEKK